MEKGENFKNLLIAKFLYDYICIDKSIANMLVKYPVNALIYNKGD